MTQFLLFAMIFLASCSQENRLNVMLLEGQSLHHSNWHEIGDSIVSLFESSGLFNIKRVTSPPVNSDLSGFRPSFDETDVIISTYDGNRWPDDVEEEFESFIAKGGGLVTIHAADNAFTDWKAYNEMIGVGGWGGRDSTAGPYLYLDENGNIVREHSAGRCGYHGDAHNFMVRKRAHHVITETFPPAWQHPKDELYERLRGPGSNLEVIASAYADPVYKGGGREEPVCMVIHYKQGRIFHTTLGHNPQVFADRHFRDLMLRGAEWAATGTIANQ